MNLLDVFHIISEHPKYVKDIKRLIIQLGIQGKLTAQWRINNPSKTSALDWFPNARNATKRRTVTEFKKLDKTLFELPVDWRWFKLGDLTHNFGQKIPDVSFSYIDVGSVDNLTGVISDNLKIIEPNQAPSRARKIVKKGCIIYSTVRPYLLNIALVDKEFDREPIASTAFAVLNPLEGLSPKYLYYYLRSQVFIDYVESQMTGVAYPAINDSNLMEGDVAVPPPAEQIQIVKTIESLFVEVQRLETLLTQRQTLKNTYVTTILSDIGQNWHQIKSNFASFFNDSPSIKKLRQSILTEAVQGRLSAQWRRDNPAPEHARELLHRIAAEKARLIREKKIGKEKPLPPVTGEEMPYVVPEGWVWCYMQDLCPSISSGSTPPSQHWTKSGIPYLKVYNIRDQKVDFAYKEQFIDPVYHSTKSKRSILRPGDVIMNIVGPPLGKVAIIPNDYNNGS
ncbi:MAG: restriction endonuclease subunit S [Saprospiraceae bacterium]